MSLWLFCYRSFAYTEKKYIASSDISDGTAVIGKMETIVFMENLDENAVQFEIFKTIEPFSQVLQIKILASKGKEIYNFDVFDNWGNESFGYIKFVENFMELYLDCNNFSENGKNYSRYYGDTEILKLVKAEY